MTKREDPRSIRTKDMLKNAVIELLKDGFEIHQLTVQKITHKAALNRTTYYLHYLDVNDLIEHLTNDILQEISEKIELLMILPNADEKKRLVPLLDYLYSQRDYLWLLFKLEHFEKHLLLLMKQFISTRREHSLIATANMEVEIDIKAAAIVGVIMWWIKNGLQYSSDYISTQIHLLFKPS